NGVPPFGETINYVNNGAVKYGVYAGTPPLSTAGVPTTPTSPTVPGGKGVIPTVPAVNSNMADILKTFKDSTGVSASSLKSVLGGLLIGLLLLYAGVQILFFWTQAVSKGGNSFGSLFGALTDSLRTLAVVMILFFFITQ
ncbi:MAG: hypothetical protein L3J59_10310, partial [Methylococcaceae bacterium]|nr:hypothetical protein [Methylococcaceae bacterium]